MRPDFSKIIEHSLGILPHLFNNERRRINISWIFEEITINLRISN
jgi:hypothetical protein